MADLLLRVSQFAGLELQMIKDIAERAPKSYRRYYVPKKRSGYRRILHPAKETKLLQYCLMELLFPFLGSHPCAFAFVRGRQSPLLKNALHHSANPYTLRMDFAEFFPSIQPEDLFNALRSRKTGQVLVPSEEEQRFLEKCCFVSGLYNSRELPIGAPSSPFISNAVMYEFDEFVSRLATQAEFAYSRYADDLVFSTKSKGVSKAFFRKIKKTVEKWKSPTLVLNSEKTHFMSKNCRRAITGLVITPGGRVSVGRKEKRRLKSLIFRFGKQDLSQEESKYLQGYLAFLLDVEPAYFDRLCVKYGADLVREALSRNRES